LHAKALILEINQSFGQSYARRVRVAARVDLGREDHRGGKAPERMSFELVSCAA
jgi:hypothetical protein